MIQDYDAYTRSRTEQARAQAEKCRLKAQRCLGERDALALKMGKGELVVIEVPEPGAAGADMRRLIKLTDRAAAFQKKASRYESIALAAAEDDTIHHDDPAALKKVCHRLKLLTDHQRCMVEVNRLVRKGRKVEFLAMEGATEALWERFITPNLIGATGISAERMQNNLRQIAQLRKRKAELELLAGWKRAETVLNGIRLIENVDIRRVQLIFPQKLIKKVRQELWSEYRLNWYRPANAWQRKLSVKGVEIARCALQHYATTENDIYEINQRTEKAAYTGNSTYYPILRERPGRTVPAHSYLVREGGGEK